MGPIAGPSVRRERSGFTMIGLPDCRFIAARPGDSPESVPTRAMPPECRPEWFPPHRPDPPRLEWGGR